MWGLRRQNNNLSNLMSLDQSGNNSSLTNEIVEKYDKKLLNWLVQMHNSLNKDQLNLEEIGSLLELLKHIGAEDQDRYLMSLLYPESNYAKVPTPFPVPTSEVRDHFTYTITTSNADAVTNTAGGNFCFVFNPFYCADLNTGGKSTFYLNTDSSMAGTTSNNNFVARDIGQSSLPGGMYSSYRVVSCAVTVNYVGRMDIVSGTVGCGVGFNGVAPAGTVGTDKAANAAVYGNFNLIDDSYFSQRTQSINGLRMIYFPLDSTYTNFQFLSNAVSGFYFVVYGQGLPASSACIRLDFYLNYEFTVNPAYSSYVAQSPGCCGDTSTILNYATGLIQKNPNLVTQASGDNIKNPISSGGWVTKFLGGFGRALEAGSNVAKYLPGMNTLKNILGVGNYIYKAVAQPQSNETALARVEN